MKVTIAKLQLFAAQARLNVLRMIQAGKSGHMGGALSCIDVVTALYFEVMNIDPSNPKDPDRDRFILSAGHKAMAQYAVLAEKGFFDYKVLDTYGQLDTPLPGHPNMHELSGVEANTGALGHGLSIAVGMALGLKLDKSKAKVYVVMGDGELPEGSNWEAFSAASHYQANNLVVIIDKNNLQISGVSNQIMSMEPLSDRLRCFGWEVFEMDGNDMKQIVSTLTKKKQYPNKPTAIVAHTIKAKGLSFAQDKVAYHYWSPNDEELDLAKQEIQRQIVSCKEQINHE